MGAGAVQAGACEGSGQEMNIDDYTINIRYEVKPNDSQEYTLYIHNKKLQLTFTDRFTDPRDLSYLIPSGLKRISDRGEK